MFFNSAHTVYQLHLKNFEGPLELLSELISSDRLDVTQIDLAQVTEQYLAYIKAMQEFSIEIASEFFVVAATLIHSKSRRLLPKPVDEEEELLDETELLSRLKDYRRFKALGRKLEESLDKGSVYFSRGRTLNLFGAEEKRELTELTVGDLIRGIVRYRGFFIRKPVPIKRRQVSVEQKIGKIMEVLEREKEIQFSALMADENDKENLIAGFLGAAELVFRKKASVIQESLFADFLLMKKD